MIFESNQLLEMLPKAIFYCPHWLYKLCNYQYVDMLSIEIKTMHCMY